MDSSVLSNVAQVSTTNGTTRVYSSKKMNESAAAEKTDESKSKFSKEAATYEKSEAAVTGRQTDRSGIVAQMKADQQQRESQLMDIVRKMMSGQGKALGQADDMWKFLASGDFEVDPETKAQAEKDIAEDGYWGVEQISDRIVDFAIALSGGDTDKADKMISAFKKGFDEATKTWGKELPDISKRTYDAVLKKMDDWKNGGRTSTQETEA
ncbi:MAG: hypothetical protein J6N76_02850 [Lachnospiraceae bacterium]|nr:hypothetical protein [Lachnospiraceae bacterium]